MTPARVEQLSSQRKEKFQMPTWFSMRFEALQAGSSQGGLMLLLLAGLLYCFFGYRLFRFVLGMTGFLVGGGLAALLVGWLTHTHPVATVAALFIGGVCGAFALSFLYRVGVFLLGVLGGLVVVYMLLQGRTESWAPWAVLAGAVAGGLLALLTERTLMTLATAAIGAWLTVASFFFLLLHTYFKPGLEHGSSQPAVHVGTVALWASLAIVGAGTQLTFHHKKEE
jgi:hypothetical protein